MIDRQNYLDVRDFLMDCDRSRQLSPDSVSRYRSALRHLLEWADATPLPDVRRVDPTLPVYLRTARADSRDRSLSPSSIRKTLEVSRAFLRFARLEWPLRYRPLSESWVNSLQPPRDLRQSARLPVRQYYTLDIVRQLLAVSAETIRLARARVGAAMLFLSGMRADALATLPISCVDLDQRTLYQLPELGVHTKNSKAAKTHLLEIPDLLDVVYAWDRQVRAVLPANALWYAPITTDGREDLAVQYQAVKGRHAVVSDDLRLLCDRADVPYLSSHKMRHGHVVWALRQARDLEDLKAISQNVMHSSVVITDGTYGNLISNEVKNIVARLGTQTGNESLEAKIDRLLAILER